MSSHILTTPFRSLLSTVASYIFGHTPAASDRRSSDDKAHKRRRDDEETSERALAVAAAAAPTAAIAPITPSPDRPRKRRRRSAARSDSKKMVIANSDSCNTLVDLNEHDRVKSLTSPSPLFHQEGSSGVRYGETRILLPVDEGYDDDDDDDDSYYSADEEGEDDDDDDDDDDVYAPETVTTPTPCAEPQRLYLPVSPSSCSDVEAEYDAIPMDEHLSDIPVLVESAESLLSNPPVVLTSRNCADVKVLNVLQGEIGHVTPGQADIIVSDRATTCHIVALRSRSWVDSAAQEEEEVVVASLAHVDKAGYEEDLREAVRVHKSYHHCRHAAASAALSSAKQQQWKDDDEEEKKSEEEEAPPAPPAATIKMDVHILGGYSDHNSSSRSITSSLLTTFASLSSEEHGVEFTLQTCAVGRLNDDRVRGGPVGRGLALDVESGDVCLAKVDRSVMGPMTEARAARLWANAAAADDDATPPALSTVSLPEEEMSQGRSCGTDGGSLTIRAFRYRPFPEIGPILSLRDDVLIKYTSTSPDVEEEGFCRSVRSTLRFMRDVKATDVFGVRCAEDAVWRRCGRGMDANRWEKVVVV